MVWLLLRPARQGRGVWRALASSASCLPADLSVVLPPSFFCRHGRESPLKVMSSQGKIGADLPTGGPPVAKWRKSPSLPVLLPQER